MSGSWGQQLATPQAGAGQPIAAGTPFVCPGGSMVFAAASSAFNGATVALQMQLPDGATWINCGASTTLTANGMGYVLLPPGLIQVTVTGGTPTNLYASIARVIG